MLEDAQGFREFLCGGDGLYRFSTKAPVGPLSDNIAFHSIDEAETALTVARSAYQRGQDDKAREIREALGL